MIITFPNLFSFGIAYIAFLTGVFMLSWMLLATGEFLIRKLKRHFSDLETGGE